MTQTEHKSKTSDPKRKKILFFQGFQIRYVCLVGGSLVVLLLFAGFHGIFVATKFLPAETLQSFKEVLLASTGRLFFVGLIYIAVVVIAAIFLSHRAVGPAARLEEEIKAMAEGSADIRPLDVREGDELQSLVEALNRFIKKIKGKTNS